MSKADNLTDFLTDIANAIRAKKGTTELINPQDFSTEIANLSGGGSNKLTQLVDGSITEVTAEDLEGATSIREGAFGGCPSLTSVTIPNSVTSIKSSAFVFCPSLTSVVIGDGVTSIDGYAFQNCQYLTNLIIGSGVTSIGQRAFYDSVLLKIIRIKAPQAPTIEGDSFPQRIEEIQVPVGSGESYGYNWSAYFPSARIVEVSDL